MEVERSGGGVVQQAGSDSPVQLVFASADYKVRGGVLRVLVPCFNTFFREKMIFAAANEFRKHKSKT